MFNCGGEQHLPLVGEKVDSVYNVFSVFNN